MATSGGRQQHYSRQNTSEGSRNFVSRWPPTNTYLVTPSSGYPEAGEGGGGMGDGPSVPEISKIDLQHQQQQQQQHRFPAPPTQQQASLGRGERKPWLKPVSSLIRGISQAKQPQQQQQQQHGWSRRNGGGAAGFPPAIHMVPQQEPLSPGWRGPAATSSSSSVVESGTAAAAMRDREERQQQRQQQHQQQHHEAVVFGSERSRSVSPRIVRGPFGNGLSTNHHPRSSAAPPDDRQLYDLPRSHHRSRSDQVYAAEFDGRAEGGFEGFPSFFDRIRYEQQAQEQQQKYIFSGAAADAAVSAAAAVPVPRDEPAPSDPYRTPTAAGAPPPFWGEPGESPAKQQRNSARAAVKDPHRQPQKPQCLFRGCPRRPTHAAIRGERPTCCPEHSAPGMLDTTAGSGGTPAGGGSKRNRCLMPGCGKAPRYALPGQKAEYCTLHKNSTLHVDVKHPRCESALGCVRQPTFGWEGEKARFCSAHKVDGMLDVKNPRCGEPGCLKRPRYGEEGGRARFCAAHRFDDMVDLASRRSTGGASSGAKHCVSPAKRPRNGPRSIAHDSSAAAAAEAAAAALPSSPAFSLRTARGGGGRGGGGAPVPTRGHTPAHAGGHRRATSESWIDFCPKRVFETTGPKVEDGVVDLPAPRHTNTSRRTRHHTSRTVNANMAAMAAAASTTTTTSPRDSLSMMGGNGSSLTFDEDAELEGGGRTHTRAGKGVSATEVFFHQGGGSTGSSSRGGGGGGGWGSTGAACAGWLSTDRVGDAATGGKAGSVSIAALGGELAALAAAPISDASPLPSPGSAPSPLSTGVAAAPASASTSTPAPPSSSMPGFCFSKSFPGGGGAVKQEKQTMAPAATVTAPVTPQSSSDNVDEAGNGGGGGGGGGGGKGGGRGHRFNASDYEASAILLECRSGMLSGEQRI